MLEAAIFKIPAVLVIPGHIAAGIVEGVTLAPLFSAMMSGLILRNDMLELASYMPVLIFLGYTMMVGWSFHHVNFKKDPLVPNAYHVNWPEFVKGLLLAAIYVCSLYQMTESARFLLGEKGKSADVIFIIGCFELFLGYFAISGWQIVYAYTRKAWYDYRISAKQSSLLHHTSSCERQYTYYEQTIGYINVTEGTRHKVQINSSIETVLALEGSYSVR
jgi:hypothetical protein